MAKQKGPIKLSGTIGDITFYESGNQHLVKEKSGPTRQEVLTKESYARTRENAGEFGSCSSAGKLIRNALGLVGAHLTDHTAINRLTERLVRVMQSDTESRRGARRVQRGQLSILKNFEFLQGARLADSFFAPFEAVSNRQEGRCTVTIPSFLPKACITLPPHATRVKLVATALALDFQKGTAQKALSASEPLRLDINLTDPITLTCTFEAPTELALIVVLGLQFMEEHEGFCYPMREKEYNAMAVVLAEKGE
jgi:hypothetical protein